MRQHNHKKLIYLSTYNLPTYTQTMLSTLFYILSILLIKTITFVSIICISIYNMLNYLVEKLRTNPRINLICAYSFDIIATATALFAGTLVLVTTIILALTFFLFAVLPESIMPEPWSMFI